MRWIFPVLGTSEAAQGTAPWALPRPCVYEFLRITTHPRIFRSPLSPAAAQAELDALLAPPNLILLSETAARRRALAEVMRQSGARGDLVHDAHIWTLCLEHGVAELWSADRDFGRFTGLRWRNPLEG